MLCRGAGAPAGHAAGCGAPQAGREDVPQPPASLSPTASAQEQESLPGIPSWAAQLVEGGVEAPRSSREAGKQLARAEGNICHGLR